MPIVIDEEEHETGIKMLRETMKKDKEVVHTPGGHHASHDAP